MSLILDKITFEYTNGSEVIRTLNDISLSIKEGEFIGIIGHTGSGKSTLIQHMNGLLKPSSGAVYFNGRDISEKDFDLRELRTSVGMVFQYPEHQLFETTVFADVCFGPKNQGLNEKECTLRAAEALELVNMPQNLYYASPFELSGGQKRRAAIAGVIAMKPQILILDEPTAGLDPAGRDEILDMISSIHKKRNDTIVLVSHSMEDVADYADRILVLDKGQIAFDGTPKQVFSHVRELESLGLAVPGVTYFMNELAASGFDVHTDITTVAEAKEEILRCLGK